MIPRPLSRCALLIVSASLIAGAGTARAPRREPMPTADRPGWKLVFADDFSKPLNTKKWGVYSGQPGGDPGGWWSPSHAVVKHGILHLEAYRDPVFGGRWAAAGVSSAPAVRQTYGKYEVRFRADPGAGVAWSLLLWPSHGGWPPEIDFAEDGGRAGARDHIAATLHYGADDRQIQRTVRGRFSSWHVAGVEWTPGRLVYTLDHRVWARVTSVDVPHEPMEMDMQAQTGTCGDPLAPCPDASTPARVRLDVDWVAIWAYMSR
jgi:beta-glucanase (GH16 family)